MTQEKLKIAVLTPTYQRDQYLLQTRSYFQRQQMKNAELHWFVLDDSIQISTHHHIFENTLGMSYVWNAEKVPIGAKRNQLNQMALKWGADFVCSMDDDDWYGATYVAEMTQLLLDYPEFKFAGSGVDYYYEVKKNRVLKIPAVTELSSCNGVLCYRAEILTSHFYKDTAGFAEERHFLTGFPVIQQPNIQKLHLTLAHATNTVTKKNYCYGDKYLVDLSLDDFPMQEQDKQFYLALHQNSL